MARFRRRPRGGPFQKRRLAWCTNIFNETAITRDGNGNLLVALESQDWQGDSAGLTKKAHIKRIILKGDLAATPATTTIATDIVCCFFCLFVQDSDDTDANLLTTTAGSILQAHRVLWTDVQSLANIEVPAAQFGTSFAPGMRIDIDLRLNVVIEPDEELVFAIQYGSTVSETLTAAAFSGICRTLIENP